MSINALSVVEHKDAIMYCIQTYEPVLLVLTETYLTVSSATLPGNRIIKVQVLGPYCKRAGIMVFAKI